MNKLNFYKDLTPEQRKKYGNECGPSPKWLADLIPEFEWALACRHHDFNYDIGGTEEDRKWADNTFKNQMLNQLHKHGNWWQKIILKPVVYTYYSTVRLFGKAAFYFGAYLTLQQLILKANKKYGIHL